MKEIYTIGHSTFPIENLIKRIRLHNVNCIVDVRSTPYSKFAPQYNSLELKKLLNKIGMQYIFMGKEFGARQTDKSFFTEEGYLDFEKFSKSVIFKRGIERINNGIAKGYSIALMCTEKDPIDCHRNILVAKELHRLNFIIKNILEDGSIELQSEIEQRLLNLYFPKREQKDIFELISGEVDEEELIMRAYILRSCDIAYRLSED